MSNKAYRLLLKSFDADLSPKEKKQLDTALQESKSLRLEKEQLMLIRQKLNHISHPGFRPYFADRVMSQIQSSKNQYRYDLFFESLKTAFRPLAISVTLLILGLMSYNAIQSDRSFLSALLPMEEATLEQALDPSWIYFVE